MRSSGKRKKSIGLLRTKSDKRGRKVRTSEHNREQERMIKTAYGRNELVVDVLTPFQDMKIIIPIELLGPCSEGGRTSQPRVLTLVANPNGRALKGRHHSTANTESV
jgi:hypothetical protein